MSRLAELEHTLRLVAGYVDCLSGVIGHLLVMQEDGIDLPQDVIDHAREVVLNAKGVAGRCREVAS